MSHHGFKHLSIFKLTFKLFILSILSISWAGENNSFIQGIPVVASYSYHLAGRTDRIRGYLFRIDNLNQVKNPGLVFLGKGIDDKDGAYVLVNDNKYNLPPIVGKSDLKTELPSDQEMGKRGFYALSQRDDLLGKVVIPVNDAHLKKGINEVEFLKKDNSDGYEVIDARIESVTDKSPEVVGRTYRIIARGRPATVADFDFIMNYTGENKRKESDVPEWARKGVILFYRAGIDFNRLDRMFEMFDEARINLIATGVPSDTKSEDYARVKAFIDRCHANNIYVTAFFSLGGISLSSVMMNPELKNLISRDEYGDLRWREHGRTYLADLTNEDYLNERLTALKAAIDAGVDEIYYDYAIGGTGEVIEFMSKIREIIKKEGKNLTIYGNCKGDILVDDLCDLTKSEGTEEAGIFDGKWISNVAQSRFYYAAGDGWKPYRSKYEGADPGVANPGAYDVREGMKYGWKRPIAEAFAFQSHFAIAETGSKLRNGWINKDNKLAMEIWRGIVNYYQFMDKNEDNYTEVRTVSKIGLLAPPVIPSFEVALTRIPLFNAMAEQNVMFDVLLLPRIESEHLAKYAAIIIPDIPYIENEQLQVLQAYKKKGGKIYTIGSTKNLRELADVYSPSSVIQEIQGEGKRTEFLKNLGQLSGEPLISLKNAKYVIANIARKHGTDKIIVHFVNYSDARENIEVKLNLEGYAKGIDKKNITLLSPDAVPKSVKNVSVKGAVVEFTIPKLDIYDIVVIN